MRVTIIGPAFPNRGGIAHHVYYLKEELTREGHSVQVVSFRKLYPRILFPGSSQIDTSGNALDAGSQPLLSSLNPLSWASTFRAVKAFSPDLVIFQWWHSFFAPLVGTLARALRRKGLKCVLECHNVFPHERSPFDAALLRYAAHPFEYFITHSRKDRSDLSPIVSGKSISVCPLPVPSVFVTASQNLRQGRTMLFFGTVRPYKGLEVLLAALPGVLSRLECQLVIAGEFYEPIEKYMQLIRDLGIEEHVSMDNRYVPNEEITGIFDRVDVLVLPYLNATQSAVARIALANGLPIIASRTGGLSEVVEENVTGLLFPAGDSNALGAQILTYFSMGLGSKFAENIRSASPVVSKSRLVETIEQIAQGKVVSQKL